MLTDNPSRRHASLVIALHWITALLIVVVGPLASGRPPLADPLKDIHEGLAAAGYFLIGLHAVAALAHHCFLRDNTLRRMLPGRSPQP